MLSNFQNLTLPVPALFHMHNYSSHLNWITYQISLNEVRLLRFDNKNKMQQTFSFIFNPQPIKQIKILVDQKQNEVYLAILFLTKFIIYKRNTEICTYRLKLDRNIVSFQNTFVACDAKNDEKQIYFTFLTSNGQIHLVPVQNIQNKTNIKVIIQNRLCSMKLLDQNLAVGDQQGNIILIDMNNSNIIKKFDTNSLMPILHLQLINGRLIAATCQGQIFNLSQNLQAFTSVSIHHGLVNHLLVNKQKIYTFGDDCILNIIKVDTNEKQLKLQNTKYYKKRANLLIAIGNVVYLNFYEELNLEEISTK